MKKSSKILLISLVSILSVATASFGIIYFSFLHRYKGKDINNEWSSKQVFTIDDTITLEKEKDKDFIVLNFADIQMADLEDFFHQDTVHRELKYLVDTYKPDLITLTGDQTWSNENLLSLKAIISYMEEFQTPWAPIFGNHDYGNKKDSAVASQNYCCDLYENAKFCLFNRGPTNLGALGNYIINIKEEDKIIKTLYMMDLGYNEEITTKQIEWFKWNAEGIKKCNEKKYSSGIVFTHKELPQFLEALNYYNNIDNTCAESEVIVHMGFAKVNDNGFTEIAKDCGVKDFICGHEHYNNFTINYNNARFTFALKTTEIFGYYEDEDYYLNGATSITINSEGTSIHHNFVERGKFKI